MEEGGGLDLKSFPRSCKQCIKVGGCEVRQLNKLLGLMGAPLVPSQVPRLTSKSKWDGNASLLSNLLPDFILCTVLHPSENVSCPIALHIYQNNLVCSSFKDAHTIAGVWCAYFLHIHKPYKNIHRPHKNIFTSRSHIQGGGTVHCSRDEPSKQAGFTLTRSFASKKRFQNF